MVTFAERLNEALAKRNIAAAELSRLTKISEAQISAYRKGAYKAGQRNTEKIAIILNVSIPWLMGLIDDDPFSNDKNLSNLSETEKYLLSKFNSLNDKGREKVLGYLEGLVDNDSYKKIASA